MSNFEPPAPPPPPPGGGYGGPPPPPGGFGGPPPGGPPPGGFGGPAPAGDQWDLGAAVSFGWNKFQANAGQMILAALAILGGLIVLVVGYVVVQATLLSSDVTCSFDDDGTYRCDGGGPGFLTSLLFSALFFALFFVLIQFITAGFIRASLGVTEGRAFRTAEVFKFDNVGAVLVTSLLVGAGVLVGTILCYLPGIAFAFASSYAMYFVVDKGLSPVEAIKASFHLVKDNFGNAIVWWLIAAVIAGIGAALCLVGALISYPVSLLGTAYTYKKLTGQPVVP